MSDDRFDVLERLAPLFEAPEPSFEGFLRRRDRKRRNQRIAAGVVAIAVFLVPVWIVATGRAVRSHADAGRGPDRRRRRWTTSRPFFLDLRTGEQTPLPESIVRRPRLRRFTRRHEDRVRGGRRRAGARRSSSPGSTAPAIRQVTHDPTGATHPPGRRTGP